MVRLKDEERETLRGVVKKLKGSSQKVKRAPILLQADVAAPVGQIGGLPRRFRAGLRRLSEKKRLVFRVPRSRLCVASQANISDKLQQIGFSGSLSGGRGV